MRHESSDTVTSGGLTAPLGARTAATGLEALLLGHLITMVLMLVVAAGYTALAGACLGLAFLFVCLLAFDRLGR
jgi:hypothetical protein